MVFPQHFLLLFLTSQTYFFWLLFGISLNFETNYVALGYLLLLIDEINTVYPQLKARTFIYSEFADPALIRGQHLFKAGVILIPPCMHALQVKIAKECLA